jgi:hypothetical protein
MAFRAGMMPSAGPVRQKKRPPSGSLLCRSALDCACRTDTSAGTAVDAGICIDLVLAVSLNNSAYRTLAGACAAANTCIIDYKCHDNYLLYFLDYIDFKLLQLIIQEEFLAKLFKN